MDREELQVIFGMSQPVDKVSDNAKVIGTVDTGDICSITLYKDGGRYVRVVSEIDNERSWKDNCMQRFNRKV